MNSTIKLKAKAKNQLRQFLLSSADTISIEEAIHRTKKQREKVRQKSSAGNY